MSELLSPAFVAVFLAAAIAAAMPLVLAAIGETIGEQAGVLNLGVEGMLLVGAYTSFVTVLATGSFWIGVLAGAAGGAAMSLIMLVLNTWLGLNQIVVGLAITLAGQGITSVLYDRFYATASPRTGSAPELVVPGLADVPVVGPAVFQQPALFWVMILLAIVVSWCLRRTNWGLSTRAAGQKPASLDAAGGSVMRTRSQAVLLGGTFAGLGGGYLALVSTGAFTPVMTGGLGFVAIVITMLSRGRISWVLGTSFVYGVTVAIGTVLQLTDLKVPIDVVKMLPFVVVMLTLIVFARSAYIPPALGVPYTRGAR